MAGGMEKNWQRMYWRWRLLSDNMQRVSTQGVSASLWLCLSARLVTEKDPEAALRSGLWLRTESAEAEHRLWAVHFPLWGSGLITGASQNLSFSAIPGIFQERTAQGYGVRDREQGDGHVG